MTPALITRHSDQVAALCRRHRVHRLDVFGSVVDGSFDPTTSDIDFLVEFETLPVSEYADAWFALKEGLEAIFGRPVDLITDAAATNPYFCDSVAASRQPVYAAG